MEEHEGVLNRNKGSRVRKNHLKRAKDEGKDEEVIAQIIFEQKHFQILCLIFLILL